MFARKLTKAEEKEIFFFCSKLGSDFDLVSYDI